MNSAEEVMSEIYNTLVQIRYPEITMAEAKNVEFTILTGENRISLLSWLLAEKSSQIATTLEKLKGTALQDELLKYYSEIGLCTNRDLLLGNCPLKEQLPTLKLLLDFMKNVHVESSNITCDRKESIDDILQVYVNEDSSVMPSLSNIKPKLNYTDAVQYFEDIKKDLFEHSKTGTDCKSEDFENSQESCTQDDKREGNEDEQDIQFNTEKKKFIEAFSSIESWPMSNSSHVKSTSYCMDTDVKNIYSDFSTLKQILQTNNEIINTTIPKGLNKTNTPLTAIIQDTVILTDEVRSMFINDY